MSMQSVLRFVCLLGLITATSVSASIDAPIPLRVLYEQSKVVAVVEILEGHVVHAGGGDCGARYKGRVIDNTKNAATNQLIEFGFVPSLKVGARYLVLLDDYENVPLERMADFQPRCRSVLPGLALVGQWRGAMEVTASAEDPSRKESWTVKRVNLVEYPLATRSRLVDGERQLVYTDMVARMKDRAAVSR